MREIIILVGVGALALIYLRRYLLVEKGITFGSLFFRQKTVVHQPKTEDKPTELTASEFIPPPDQVDDKDRAKADSFVKKADVLLRKGDDKEAEKFFIKALSLDPSCIDAYKRLAYMYLRQQQFGKAENIYRKIIVSIIDDPALYSNLGLALYSQQKLEDAKQFYKKAVELDNTRAGRFFSLGQIYYELDNFEDALDSFKRAIDMDPANLDYLLTLAHFYIDRGVINEAKQILEDILSTFPDHAEAKDLLDSLN